MKRLYFVLIDGKSEGPYTFEKIRNMGIHPDTMIWRHGIKKWVLIKNLKEFRYIIPPPSPTCLLTDSKVTDLPPSQEISTPITKFAGFWFRLGAYLIDSIIIGFVASFIYAIFNLPISEDQIIRILSDSLILFKPNIVLIFFMTLFYFVLFEYSDFQATPGKAIMGLRVTTTSGSQISAERALGRFLGKIISGVLLFAGYMMIGLTKNKQGLHDIIAKCYVVKGPPKYLMAYRTSKFILAGSFMLFILSLFFLPGLDPY
jgi:uncharacterized RDD family membrane protein YckC